MPRTEANREDAIELLLCAADGPSTILHAAKALGLPEGDLMITLAFKALLTADEGTFGECYVDYYLDADSAGWAMPVLGDKVIAASHGWQHACLEAAQLLIDEEV